MRRIVSSFLEISPNRCDRRDNPTIKDAPIIIARTKIKSSDITRETRFQRWIHFSIRPISLLPAMIVARERARD